MVQAESAATKWRKLNLGCGQDKRSDYVNVDLLAGQEPDIVANVLDLPDFPSCYYEEIIAQDVLEHFKRIETRKALYEWNRLLMPGGTLFLRTTYLNGLIHRLDNPLFQSIGWQEHLVRDLFSNQYCEGDYHLTAFTETLFRYYLWECGFDIVELHARDQWLFECTARKVQDYGFEDLIQSSPDDDSFIARAYREVLFRDPDGLGFPFFQAELRENRRTRRDVVKHLLLSDERKQTMIAKAPPFPRQLETRPRGFLATYLRRWGRTTCTSSESSSRC